jgi:hypothetical protein
MDIYKCPKTIFPKNFPKKKQDILNNKSLDLLKELGGHYLSTTTFLDMFLIIFSSFSTSLLPDPPIDSTISLLY